jgi:hypothetical protein
MKNKIEGYDIMAMTTAERLRNQIDTQMTSYNWLFHLLNNKTIIEFSFCMI